MIDFPAQVSRQEASWPSTRELGYQTTAGLFNVVLGGSAARSEERSVFLGRSARSQRSRGTSHAYHTNSLASVTRVFRGCTWSATRTGVAACRSLPRLNAIGSDTTSTKTACSPRPTH